LTSGEAIPAEYVQITDIARDFAQLDVILDIPDAGYSQYGPWGDR
jgi:hypothetical protein